MTGRPWLPRAGFVAAFLGAILLGGCGKTGHVWPEDEKLRVMVTFPPLYCFAVNVAGDDAHVLSLLDSTGVHDYHPSPNDALKLHGADIFFCNGLELDDEFAKTVANNASNPKLPANLFEVSDGIPKDQLRKMGKHGHDAHAGHAHKHGEMDPHVWLGPPEAIKMVEFIRDKLKEADPPHAKGYDERADKYIKELNEKVLAYGKEKFKDKKDKKIITFHDSLGYFARAFGLEIAASIQPVAGEEDTSGKLLANLVDLCLKEKIKVIAVEPNQMTSTPAKALVDQLKSKGIKDAEIVEVDMLESAPRSQLMDNEKARNYYTEKMKENIDRLAKALK
jgi:ABC-type Zn uptake system ZnuABC Zn-binding protein ZnuA